MKLSLNGSIPYANAPSHDLVLLYVPNVRAISLSELKDLFAEIPKSPPQRSNHRGRHKMAKPANYTAYRNALQIETYVRVVMGSIATSTKSLPLSSRQRRGSERTSGMPHIKRRLLSASGTAMDCPRKKCPLSDFIPLHRVRA